MERVTRVRGARRDENDDPVPPEPDKTLWASAVAPGASTNNKDRGRNGAKVAFTVYFFRPRISVRGDKLRVRGTLCDIVVQDWRSPHSAAGALRSSASSGKG